MPGPAVFLAAKLDDRRRASILSMGFSHATMCPHCGRDAPIVYRGSLPYCTACGGVRVPLSGPSVNLAGKPSQVGGAVTRVVGWLVLFFGLCLALGLGGVIYGVATSAVALAISLPVAMIALVTAFVLLRSGGSLSRAGSNVERATREQALLQLAAHRGAVTASDAARALGVSAVEADEMLTELAKRQPERMSVDVDTEGVVWFRPTSVLERASEPPETRLRVEGGAVEVSEGQGLDPEGEDLDDLEDASRRRAETRR